MRSDDFDLPPFEILSFGPFVALPFERRLVRDGTPVSLSSRAFDLLIALIERPGRVVNKRTLMKTAWPDSIVVDSCLRVQIAHLRKVLNDGHDGARYIMNV